MKTDTVTNVNRGRQFLKSIITNQKFYLACIILLVGIGTSILNINFLSVSNFMTILQQVSVLGIVTMAMALLMISGLLDLSLGTMIGMICVVLCTLVKNYDTPAWVLIIVALAIGVLSGLFNGVIVSKSKCVPLIITLGTSYMFKGVAMLISGGHFMTLNRRLDWLGRAKLFGEIPLSILFLALMLVVSYFILNNTRYGRRLTAVGGNEENAFMSGIKVDRYKISNYVVAGLFTAIAAIVLVARLDAVTPAMGDDYGLKAIAAAVVGGITFEGGKGTIGGAFLGCILLGVIANSMNIVSVSPHLQTAVLGAIIVIAVVISNIENLKK